GPKCQNVVRAHELTWQRHRIWPRPWFEEHDCPDGCPVELKRYALRLQRSDIEEAAYCDLEKARTRPLGAEDDGRRAPRTPAYANVVAPPAVPQIAVCVGRPKVDRRSVRKERRAIRARWHGGVP